MTYIWLNTKTRCITDAINPFTIKYIPSYNQIHSLIQSNTFPHTIVIHSLIQSNTFPHTIVIHSLIQSNTFPHTIVIHTTTLSKFKAFAA